LANVDRSRTPWLIGVIHAPWYSSNRAHFGDGEEMRKSMELVLKQANVDLIFAGHVHAYERMVCDFFPCYLILMLMYAFLVMHWSYLSIL
jgi:hypothetical protein